MSGAGVFLFFVVALAATGEGVTFEIKFERFVVEVFFLRRLARIRPKRVLQQHTVGEPHDIEPRARRSIPRPPIPAVRHRARPERTAVAVRWMTEHRR